MIFVSMTKGRVEVFGHGKANVCGAVSWITDVIYAWFYRFYPEAVITYRRGSGGVQFAYDERFYDWAGVVLLFVESGLHDLARRHPEDLKISTKPLFNGELPWGWEGRTPPTDDLHPHPALTFDWSAV
jgi:uncharacterized protein YsxB (DUF464 family)